MKTSQEIELEAKEVLLKMLRDIAFVQIENVQDQQLLLDRMADAVIRIKTPDGPKILIVEVKSNGQPRFARKAADQLAQYTSQIPGSYGIFMAPFISEDSQAMLYERNIGYMDLSGNGKISFWPVYIKTVADRNPYVQRRELRSLYSQRSTKTLMILRVLLNAPGKAWRTEDLALESDSSLGQVSNVKKKLEDREWIQSVKGGIRLSEPEKLLTEWAENYRPGFNEYRDFYSMDSVQAIENSLVQYCSDNAIKFALTEFSGGARYAPAVRYQRVSAYIENDFINTIAQELSWKEVKTGANIRLYIPIDDGYFYGKRWIDGAEIASPVQVFLDLKNLRGRGEEAAEAVLKEVLTKQWH